MPTEHDTIATKLNNPLISNSLDEYSLERQRTTFDLKNKTIERLGTNKYSIQAIPKYRGL